ncbi:MAG: adenylate/guanylate cyclase domain-containing protein [Candidatus Hydrogenedentota bacterium]
MDCSSCGHSNRPEAKFCESCGTALERSCESCGVVLRPEARFCDSCGTKVESSSPTPSPPPSSSTKPPRAAEGERRIVTVLFADAVGHTPISEALDEEEVYNLMQGCFARMQTAVERYGGSVNQFTGDGVLALFGAPIAHEDSARRAVAAALELQESLAEYAADVKKKLPIECSYRVGLNTGPVVIGKISDNLDLEFAAVGDTVNLAARMESIAESGTVYLSENTYKAVKYFYECESLGEQEIKGKSKPVHVYKALREKEIHTRIQLSVERGLTPYIGRDQEQANLQGYLKKASEGHGQVVLLSGEAGMGKSRTLLEFRKSIADDTVLWLSGQCISFGDNIPFLSVIDLLKSAFSITETDEETAIIEKIDAGVSHWQSDEKATAPYIKYLLNVDHGDESLTDMDPMVRRAGFLDAFRAFLRAISREQTVVMVIEDLHWIDEHSEDIVNMLADLVGNTSVLMLLTARPGYAASIGARSYFSQLALTQLPPTESDRIAEAAFGSMDIPKALKDVITQKADGNPFYIEEVIRSLEETGVLNRDDATEAENVASIRIPDTIHEVILSRLDRLEPGAREAMQLASVIGREFTVRLLNRISDLEDRLTDSLDQLKSLELIYETGYQSELAYMFKHALTHDVAYSTLLIERRKELHRTVAMAIETLFEERLTDHYEALAYHYALAEDDEPALDYLVKAGDKAVAAYANREAIDYYQQALNLCEKIDNQDELASIAHKRGVLYLGMSEFEESIEDLNRVIQYGKNHDDRYRQGSALALRSYVEWEGHQFDTARATSREAIELAADEFPGARFSATVTLWSNLNVTGHHEEARVLIPEITKLASTVDEPFFQALWGAFLPLGQYWKADFDDSILTISQWRPQIDSVLVAQIICEWVTCLSLGGKGEYEEALSRLKAAHQFTDRIDNVFYLIRILNTIGWIYGEVHHLEEAIAWNTKGINTARDFDTLDSEVESNARLNLGDNLVELGKLDEAEEHFQWVEAIARNPKPVDMMSINNYSAHCFHSYGELWRIRGDLEKALAYAEDCIDVARKSDRPKNEVKGLRLKGATLHQQGHLTNADIALEQALTIARKIKNPPQLWKTYRAIAELCTTQERLDDAREAYRNTLEVMQSMADGLGDELKTIFIASKPFSEIAALSKI